MDNITTNFWDVLLWSFWFFTWIAAIMVWVRCVFDLFRDRSLSGWAKAGWAVLLIFVPWLGALIYLIVRGRSMNERQMKEVADMQAQQAQYIKQVAGSSSAEASPADQIASAKSLLDSGAITQDEFGALKAKALAWHGVAVRPQTNGTVMENCRGLTVRLAAGAAVGVLALGACSSESSLPDTRVSAKQEALTQAQAEAASARSHFCEAATDYLTAVDRYGDVLTATAPTVGDVKSAGRDLEQPREDVTAAAADAASAQQAVVEAEQALAAAKAAASSSTAAGTSSAAPTSSPASPSPTTSVPPATVNRVKQAETEFAAAQKGISDQTPLRQAAEQFNAAAVALEMSWLALFADAGCLAGEAEQTAQQAVHDYTAALQQSLTDAGYYAGKVDGVYGPATVDAVQALQKAYGLPVTGTVDKATQAALQADLEAKGGAAAQESLASTAALQQTLKLAGFWDGPVDGHWTPALTEALKKFQTELGVPASGTVDGATIAALEKAIAKTKQPPPSTASPGSGSPTSTPPTPTQS